MTQNCIFARHAEYSNSTTNFSVANAKSSAGGGGARVAHPQDYNRSDVAPIVRLLNERRPAAIAWLVIAIILNTINRVRGRWFPPHIGKEVLKLLPALTNLDAAPAVILELLIGWRVASIFHRAPRAVLCRTIVVRRMPVRPSAFIEDGKIFRASAVRITDFAVQAAARLYPRSLRRRAKVGGVYELFYTAIASAKPKRPAIANFRIFSDDEKPSESLADYVDQSHGWTITPRLAHCKVSRA